MELDWSALQKEASTAGVIPAGEYNCAIISAEATTSSTGKPMIKFKARVLDGPQKDKPVWSQFTISPESAMALRMYFMQMAAFGLDSEYFGKQPSIADVARNLVNRAAVFTLSIRQWQGADRNQVDGVKALSGGAPVPPGVVTGPATVQTTMGNTPVSTSTPMSAAFASNVTGPPIPTASASPAAPTTPTPSTSTPPPPAQPF